MTGRPDGGRSSLRALSGYASIALAAVMFGVAGAVAKALFHANVSPVALTALRSFMAVALLAPAALLVTRGRLGVTRRQLGYLLVMAALLTLVNLTFYVAISATQVAVAILLEYTAPVFVVMIGLVLGTHVINRATLAVIGLSALGCYLLTGAYGLDWGRLSLLGTTVGLACGLCFAVYSLWGNRGERLGLSSTIVTLYSFLFSAAVWAAALPALQLTSLDYRPQVVAYLLFIGVFATAVPYWLLNRGLRLVDAFPATVIGMLDPVVAGAAAFALLGEVLQVPQIVGVAVLLLTLAYMKRNEGSLVRPSAPPAGDRGTGDRRRP